MTNISRHYRVDDSGSRRLLHSESVFFLHFRSFIHVVQMHPGGLLQFSKEKLLRSWHLFSLAFLHCGRTGRKTLLGQ